MAASLDEEALVSLGLARLSRDAAAKAQGQAARDHLRFLRDARRAGWSWPRIGKAIGLSEVAVRRYWQRNRHRADRMGRSQDAENHRALQAAT